MLAPPAKPQYRCSCAVCSSCRNRDFHNSISAETRRTTQLIRTPLSTISSGGAGRACDKPSSSSRWWSRSCPSAIADDLAGRTISLARVVLMARVEPRIFGEQGVHRETVTSHRVRLVAHRWRCGSVEFACGFAGERKVDEPGRLARKPDFSPSAPSFGATAALASTEARTRTWLPYGAMELSRGDNRRRSYHVVPWKVRTKLVGGDEQGRGGGDDRPG